MDTLGGGYTFLEPALASSLTMPDVRHLQHDRSQYLIRFKLNSLQQKYALVTQMKDFGYVVSSTSCLNNWNVLI